MIGGNAMLESDDDSIEDTPPTSQCPQTDVTQALKDITTMLSTVVKRMDNMENTLRNGYSSVSSTSACETPGKSKKAKGSVPLVVRVSN